MDAREFASLLHELELLKKLFILNTLKTGADQLEVGRILGISDRQVRNILAGNS